MTNYKFGSPEELIKAAEENIVTAAAESGINADDLQDCIEEAKEGKFQFLSFLMVEQKVKTELADFNLAGSIMGDWAEYIKNEAYGNEAMARAILLPEKKMADCLAVLLKYSFENSFDVPTEIVKKAMPNNNFKVKLGIPGMAKARRLIADFFTD